MGVCGYHPCAPSPLPAAVEAIHPDRAEHSHCLQSLSLPKTVARPSSILWLMPKAPAPRTIARVCRWRKPSFAFAFAQLQFQRGGQRLREPLHVGVGRERPARAARLRQPLRAGEGRDRERRGRRARAVRHGAHGLRRHARQRVRVGVRPQGACSPVARRGAAWHPLRIRRRPVHDGSMLWRAGGVSRVVCLWQGAIGNGSGSDSSTPALVTIGAQVCHAWNVACFHPQHGTYAAWLGCLAQLRAVWLSCGDQQTAALTDSGEAYFWGDTLAGMRMSNHRPQCRALANAAVWRTTGRPLAPRRTGYHAARDTTRADVEQLAIRVRARLDPRTRLRISGPRSDHSASCAA